MSKLIVSLARAAAADPDRFGPKAANQAALGHAGLPIPGGFCVDAAAYRLQVAALGLTDAVARAADHDHMTARRHVSRVRIALFDQPIIDAVREPLLAAWRALVADNPGLTVVRSSALIEDRAGTSFAGQFESFLGLANETDFLTAVRACWAALWSTRAIRYMDGHGLNPSDTAMALLVQPLIDARASGGGMSLTAEGGMMLSATWGLGEAIAQGEVVPDRYQLTRDGELRETTAGRKDHSVDCMHHHATPGTRAVARDMAGEPCLDAAQARALGGMMRQAEDLLGVPVEVEWAMDDAGIKMLQARPLRMEPAPIPDAGWLRLPALRGHPGGIGWASGRACVINCECELGRVAPGDVLVTRVAGPALGQVLQRVSGVVAELGGSTSHLAALARERSIPMVLGVLDATLKIPDGAHVGVDGVGGVVRWSE